MTTCPKCSAQIAVDDVNVREGVALCRSCGSVLRVADIAEPTTAGPTVDPNSPPPGAWCVDDGIEIRIGASTRSWMALFLIPFALVWSGGSLGGIYGTQIASGQFSLVLSLFGVPFLLGSILLWSVALMVLFGRTQVKLRGDEGELFTGIGQIGFRQTFHAAEIAKVYEDRARWQGIGSHGMAIVLEGRTRMKFGEGLNEPRRYFVLNMLRALITERPNSQKA